MCIGTTAITLQRRSFMPLLSSLRSLRYHWHASVIPITIHVTASISSSGSGCRAWASMRARCIRRIITSQLLRKWVETCEWDMEEVICTPVKRRRTLRLHKLQNWLRPVYSCHARRTVSAWKIFLAKTNTAYRWPRCILKCLFGRNFSGLFQHCYRCSIISTVTLLLVWPSTDKIIHILYIRPLGSTNNLRFKKGGADHVRSIVDYTVEEHTKVVHSLPKICKYSIHSLAVLRRFAFKRIFRMNRTLQIDYAHANLRFNYLSRPTCRLRDVCPLYWTRICWLRLCPLTTLIMAMSVLEDAPFTAYPHTTAYLQCETDAIASLFAMIVFTWAQS